MSELFYSKGPSTRIYREWDTSSVTTMYRMFRGAGVQPGYRYMGYLERHDHGRCSTHHAFNQDIRYSGTPRASRTMSGNDVRDQATAFNQTYRDGTSARSRP